MAPANTQTIGKAFIVYGTVKAVSPTGVERILTPNSPVYAHERIVTGPDGSISIALADQQGHLDLGRMSDVQLDEDVYGGGHAGGGADAVAQVTDIQAALQDGTIDPTTDLPAPAAGTGTGGAPGARGGGRQVVVFESDHMEVMPDSGAETIGVGLNFLDPPPGGRPEESPAISGEVPVIEPSIPLVGHAELTFDEANLPFGTHPVAGSQIQGGTLADLGVHFGDGGPGTLDFGNGQTITIDGSNTSLTVEGKYGDLTINGDGTWTYTLDGNTLDHPGKGATGTADQVGDQFSFGAIDSNGNRADGGSVVIHILDDGPTLDVGNQSVDESNGVGQGHEVNGTLNFNFGADRAGSSLTLSAEGATWDADAKTLTGADNAWTLHVNDDGTYTFTQLKAMDHPNTDDPNDPLDIKITAAVTDGDGDSISKDFTVTVYDDGPRLDVDDQTVDETGPSHTVDGKLEFNFGADQTGSSLTLSADGATWDALNQTLTGADDAWTLHVNGDGTYTFTQLKALDHPNSSDPNDPLDIKITAVATDGDGDSISKDFTVTVLDDGPMIGLSEGSEKASLANTPDASTTGHFDVNFGYDGPADNSALQLGDIKGDSLVGKTVVDNHGHALTSGGKALVYESDGAGGIHAVIDGTHDSVFSVSLDPGSGTYKVTMGDHVLDPLQATTVFSNDTTGGTASVDFDITNDMQVHVTGTCNGNPANVQWDSKGLGVDSGKGDHTIGTGDFLSMEFQDGNGNTQSVESVHFTLTGLGQIQNGDTFIPETAHYATYLNGVLVEEGTITGSANGEVDFSLKSSGFDTIVFDTNKAAKGSAYQVKSLTVDQLDHDPNLSYTVTATDGDGDTAKTDPFDVTIKSAGSSDTTEHKAGLLSTAAAEDLHRDGGDAIHEGSGHDHAGSGGAHGAFGGSEGGGNEMHDQGGLDHLVGSVGHH